MCAEAIGYRKEDGEQYVHEWNDEDDLAQDESDAPFQLQVIRYCGLSEKLSTTSLSGIE